MVLFGTLLGVCVLACAVGAWRFWGHRTTVFAPGESFVAPAQTPEELRRAWQDGTAEAIRSYAQTTDAQAAKTALLAQRVPAEQREIHLGLVLALESLLQARPGAEADWQREVAKFEALPRL